MRASSEQSAIINAVAGGNHVIGDAVAGAGKTTTVLLLASKVPTKNIMQVTYNSALRLEVKQKAHAQSIANLQIHTYHSLATTHYSSAAFTDDIMRTVINHDAPLLASVDPIDIFIVDEAQDMMGLYYELLRKFLRDTKSQPILLIIGDQYQNIYAFKGADSRFLTRASNIWNNEIITLPMTTSYRVTKPIAHFINHYMLGYERIVAHREGPPVLYMRTNTWEYDRVTKIAKIISELISPDGYRIPEHGMQPVKVKPDEIFILAPSVKKSPNNTKSGLVMLENILVNIYHIVCYTPPSDEIEINEDARKGKLVFCTFHQSKGRERKVVFVFGFDGSYGPVFTPDEDYSVCPNTMYVAATRASEFLVLVENSASCPPHFLCQKPVMGRNRIPDYPVYLMEYDPSSDKPKSPRITRQAIANGADPDEDNPRPYSPSTFGAFMCDELSIELQQFIYEFQQLSDRVMDVNVTSVVKTRGTKPECAHGVRWSIPPTCVEGCTRRRDYKDTRASLYEDISDITGVAVTTMLEATIRAPGRTSVEDWIYDKNRSTPLIDDFTSEHNNGSFFEPKNNRTEIYLRMCALYITVQSGYVSRYKQLLGTHESNRFKWLTDADVQQMQDNLLQWMPNPDKYQFERVLESAGKYIEGVQPRVIMSGRVDALSEEPGGILWEFKCVKEFSSSHFLQLMCYAWLWHDNYEAEEGPRRFILMNLRTGEMYELMMPDENAWSQLDAFIKRVFNHEVKSIADAEFIDKYSAI